MTEYRFTLGGKKGVLSVTNPDSAQCIEDYCDVANPFYLVDELILMVAQPDKQQLSIKHPNCGLLQIAELNNLVEVSIILPNKSLTRIV